MSIPNLPPDIQHVGPGVVLADMPCSTDAENSVLLVRISDSVTRDDVEISLMSLFQLPHEPDFTSEKVRMYRPAHGENKEFGVLNSEWSIRSCCSYLLRLFALECRSFCACDF